MLNFCFTEILMINAAINLYYYHMIKMICVRNYIKVMRSANQKFFFQLKVGGGGSGH